MRQINQDIILRAKQLPRHGNNIDDAFRDSLRNLTNGDANTLAGIGKLNEAVKALGDQYIAVAKNTNFLETATADLQKSFGLNIQDATRFYGRLTEISKEFGIGASQIAVYSKNLKGLIGGYANLANQSLSPVVKSLLQAQNIIQTNLKLSGDVANKFTMFAALQGKSADAMLVKEEKIAEAITKKTGMTVTLTDLVSDMASVTEDLQLQYGKIPGRLELAVVKAKMLGFSMSDLNKTGTHLLDIQSSVGDELEYQLLTGRRLIGDQKTSAELQGKSLTNAYREAQIKGDANQQVKIMNALIRQEGDSLRNNLFARQQMAKLLGTDEATLARTLAKQKLLQDLGAESLMDMASDTLEAEIQKLPGFEALSPEKKKEALDKLAAANEQRTPDERMADYLQSMVSDGIKLIAGPEALGQIAQDAAEGKLKGLQSLTEYGQGAIIGNASTAPGTAQTLGAAINLGQIGSTIAANVADAISKVMDPTQWATVFASAVGITSPITTPTLAVTGEENDAVIGPDSTILFSGGKGTLFNDNDYIAASTTNPLSGGGGGWAQVVAAIQEQTRALSNNSTSTGINTDYWT